jgi:PAS domain S-box-containing protein
MQTDAGEIDPSVPDPSQRRPELDLLRAVIEQAPDAIIMTDNSGAVRIWNRRATEIFGFSMREAIEGGLDLIIPEDLKPVHDRGFRAALAAGKTKSEGRATLTRAKHKNGSKLYVEMSFAIVADASGTVSGALAIARDVTQRRLAELARRKNEG